MTDQEKMELMRLEQQLGAVGSQNAVAPQNNGILGQVGDFLTNSWFDDSYDDGKEYRSGGISGFFDDLLYGADYNEREARGTGGKPFQGADGKYYSFNPITQQTTQVQGYNPKLASVGYGFNGGNMETLYQTNPDGTVEMIGRDQFNIDQQNANTSQYNSRTNRLNAETANVNAQIAKGRLGLDNRKENAKVRKESQWSDYDDQGRSFFTDLNGTVYMRKLGDNRVINTHNNTVEAIDPVTKQNIQLQQAAQMTVAEQQVQQPVQQPQPEQFVSTPAAQTQMKEVIDNDYFLSPKEKEAKALKAKETEEAELKLDQELLDITEMINVSNMTEEIQDVVGAIEGNSILSGISDVFSFGGDAALRSKLQSYEDQAFMAGRPGLQGGGQITDYEGKRVEGTLMKIPWHENNPAATQEVVRKFAQRKLDVVNLENKRLGRPTYKLEVNPKDGSYSVVPEEKKVDKQMPADISDLMSKYGSSK